MSSTGHTESVLGTTQRTAPIAGGIGRGTRTGRLARRAAGLVAAASLATVGLVGISTSASATDLAASTTPGPSQLTLAPAQHAAAGTTLGHIVLATAQTGPAGPTSAPTPTKDAPLKAAKAKAAKAAKAKAAKAKSGKSGKAPKAATRVR